MNKFLSQQKIKLVLLSLALLFIGICNSPIFAQNDPGPLTELVINYSTSGDHTLITGVALARIRVYRIYLYCNAANNIIIKDTTPTTLSPVMNLSASQGFVFDYTDYPWYTTALGAGFVINMSAAQQCSGRVYYIIS